MKIVIRKSFLREERGATMVEFSLMAPLLFLLTLGIVEFGVIMHQFQALNAATAMAARIAATRGPVITGIPDCGVGTSGTAGTYCSQVSGSKTWTPVSCAGNSTAGNCNVTLLARILQEMRLVYPPLQASNFTVTYGPSGLGFIGLGKPVPNVTITISGVTANFAVLGAFGLGGLTLPPFTTTIPAEDLSGI